MPNQYLGKIIRKITKQRLKCEKELLTWDRNRGNRLKIWMSQNIAFKQRSPKDSIDFSWFQKYHGFSHILLVFQGKNKVKIKSNCTKVFLLQKPHRTSFLISPDLLRALKIFSFSTFTDGSEAQFIYSLSS